jgi:hypothetical protein
VRGDWKGIEQMNEIIIGKPKRDKNGKPGIMKRLAADTRTVGHGDVDISDPTREAIEEIARLREAIKVFEVYDMRNSDVHPDGALAMIPVPWGALRRLCELANREP